MRKRSSTRDLFVRSLAPSGFSPNLEDNIVCSHCQDAAFSLWPYEFNASHGERSAALGKSSRDGGFYVRGKAQGRATGSVTFWHLINTVHDLTTGGIGLRVLTGQGAAIDTTTAAGKLVLGIFAALAEFERELITERTRAGLAAARARAQAENDGGEASARDGEQGQARHHRRRALRRTRDHRADALSARRAGRDAPDGWQESHRPVPVCIIQEF